MHDKKTCRFKSENCSSGKLSKVRMAGMTAANAVGDKIPMLVTGKAQKPCCIKNVKIYLADIDIKKSWIDGVLFEE